MIANEWGILKYLLKNDEYILDMILSSCYSVINSNIENALTWKVNMETLVESLRLVKADKG